jgi:hypothetical protein
MSGIVIYILFRDGFYYIHGYRYIDGNMAISTYVHTIEGYKPKIKVTDKSKIVKPILYIDGISNNLDALKEYIKSENNTLDITIITNLDSVDLNVKYNLIKLEELDGLATNILAEYNDCNYLKNISIFTTTTDIKGYWTLNSCLINNPFFYAKDIYKYDIDNNTFILLDYLEPDDIGIKSSEALLGIVKVPNFTLKEDEVMSIYRTIYDSNILKLNRFNILNIKKPYNVRLFKLNLAILDKFKMPSIFDLTGNYLDTLKEELISTIKSPGLPLLTHSISLNTIIDILESQDRSGAYIAELDITSQLYEQKGKYPVFKYKGIDEAIKLDIDKEFSSSGIELISGVNIVPFRVLKAIERDVESVVLLKDKLFNGYNKWYIKILTKSYGMAIYYNISNRIL